MIRRFRPDDLERMKEITVACFEGVSIDGAIERRYGIVGGKGWAWRKARHIDADAAANPGGIFVYEEDGHLVGYVTTRLDADARVGWVPNIATDPAHQGKGVGRALLEAAIEYLRDAGMVVARIETLEHNAVGRHLYPSVGFEELGRQVFFGMRL